MATQVKDQLSEDATAALAAGLSYGKYKALQRENMLPQTDPSTTTVESKSICVVCGKPVPVKKRKYCGPECADVARNRQHQLAKKK